MGHGEGAHGRSLSAWREGSDVPSDPLVALSWDNWFSIAALALAGVSLVLAGVSTLFARRADSRAGRAEKRSERSERREEERLRA